MITLISILQAFFGSDFLFEYQQRLLISAVKKHIRSYLTGSMIRTIDVIINFPELSVVNFDKAIKDLEYDRVIIDLHHELKRL